MDETLLALDNYEKETQRSRETTGNNHFGRKLNYCAICKKYKKEFCSHFENVHSDTPDGRKLNELNNIVDN